MTRFACFLASLGPCGYFPIAPATFASFVIALGYWAMPAGRSPLVDVAALIVTTAVGIWAAGRAESAWGHDARRIVIDEGAGMAMTLLFLPAGLEVAVAAFIAFRIFDILKPPPARQAEKLPGGLGVVMDDVLAGVYANLTVRAYLYFAG